MLLQCLYFLVQFTNLCSDVLHVCFHCVFLGFNTVGGVLLQQINPVIHVFKYLLHICYLTAHCHQQWCGGSYGVFGVVYHALVCYNVGSIYLYLTCHSHKLFSHGVE